MKFRPNFCNFILGPYCAEKIHTSAFICCLHPSKEACPWTNHKKKIRGRKARTFCFWKTNFVHSRFGTYYGLLRGYFGLKFLPDIRHCVHWVLAEIWTLDLSHKTGNKFFSWVNTHPFDLKFLAFCPKISGHSYVEFQEKTISLEIFRNFVQTKSIIYRNLWNSALISAISFQVRIALKKLTQVLSYVVCTQVKRHVHK